MRLLLVVFVFIYCELGDSSVRQTYVYSSKEFHFSEIYSYIRTNVEGNYVSHPNDKGGETYGGIARRLHPQWYGWTHVDAAKPLERHDQVEAAEMWVQDFYLDLWTKEGFENIRDKNLALNLFDFRIHSSPRTVTKLTNRVLEQMGCEPIRIKRDWVDDRFNQVDPQEFITRLKMQRLALFNYLVNKNPDQEVFLEGWKNRLANI